MPMKNTFGYILIICLLIAGLWAISMLPAPHVVRHVYKPRLPFVSHVSTVNFPKNAHTVKIAGKIAGRYWTALDGVKNMIVTVTKDGDLPSDANDPLVWVFWQAGDTNQFPNGTTMMGYPPSVSATLGIISPASFDVDVESTTLVAGTYPVELDYDGDGREVHYLGTMVWPGPTPPKPTAAISASPNPAPGTTGASTVTWTSTGADTAVVSGPGLSSTALNGSQGVALTASPSTYMIAATNAQGTTNASVDVTVTDPTASISAAPNPVTA